MGGQALGLVETYGYVSAVEAADACLKAANVNLICCEIVTGGLVTIEIMGDVGSVKAAVDAAGASVKRMGHLVSTHVIPRPAAETMKIIKKTELSPETEADGHPEAGAEGHELSPGHPGQHPESAERTELSPEIGGCGNELPPQREVLISMKVTDLRTLARQLSGIRMDKGSIKFARKEELISAITDYYERKSE